MKIKTGTRFYVINKDETKDLYIYCGKIATGDCYNRLLFRMTRNNVMETRKECFSLVETEWIKQRKETGRLFITNYVNQKEAKKLKEEYENF